MFEAARTGEVSSRIIKMRTLKHIAAIAKGEFNGRRKWAQRNVFGTDLADTEQFQWQDFCLGISYYKLNLIQRELGSQPNVFGLAT